RRSTCQDYGPRQAHQRQDCRDHGSVE
ncbi:hypothetical protein BN1723_019470, partial [Verticillium longisporum]